MPNYKHQLDDFIKKSRKKIFEIKTGIETEDFIKLYNEYGELQESLPIRELIKFMNWGNKIPLILNFEYIKFFIEECMYFDKSFSIYNNLEIIKDWLIYEIIDVKKDLL